MRHRKLATKLGRSSSHRRAMFRNLVTSLLEHERIETTHVKAKQVRRLADRMITLGKRGTLHARRRALRVVRSRQVASKLFAELADRYRERPGGYTRVVRSRQRVGDAAPLSMVELVEGSAGAPPPPKEKRRRSQPSQTAEATPARPRRGRGKAAAEETAKPTRGRGAGAREAGKKAEKRPDKKTGPGRGGRRSARTTKGSDGKKSS